LDFHKAVWNLQQTNLMAISAFPKGGGYALEYSVTESGGESDVRDSYPFDYQAPHGKQLSEVDIKSLRSAINNLPSESASPPIERLVVVSFCQGTNWVTRSYDGGALPKPMRQIYGIIGERYETANKNDGSLNVFYQFNK